MPDFEIIRKCRVCGSEELTPLLFFGDHPLANKLKKGANDPEDKYPLTLIFCLNCSLVQIRETVKKEVLFSHYVWVTGTSATAQQFARDFYGRVRDVTELNPEDLVIEIASNDGTFLKPFIEHNYKVVGVDPATNIADIANENGVRTINTFWSSETARDIAAEYGPARFIFARNVIPHVSELHDVMSGIGLALAGDGYGAIEVHYAGNIYEQLQYDAIYHEHLSYFSIKSMEYLLRAHGFTPFNIDLSPISGGAFIFYFSKDAERPRSPMYETLWGREQAMTLNEMPSWKAFAERCHEHRQKSREMMASFPRGRVIGFGASARSSTFLNFCRFTGADLAGIIDNNTIKQGLFTAGSSIPIVSSAEGFAMNPELIFVLAWNFRDEVINECREKGYKGAFLVPFPNEPYLA